jgi:hypothetical protein
VKFLKESNCVNSSATEKISQDAQLLLDNKFSMLEDLKEVGFLNLLLIVCQNSEIFLQESNCVKSSVRKVRQDIQLHLHNTCSMLEDLKEVGFLNLTLIVCLNKETFAGGQLTYQGGA